MIKNKQLQVGNEVEEAVAKMFKKHGYWAHIMQKSRVGQPVDIVALKGDVPGWLVDAKHLEKGKKSFPFSRIEANQATTLDYARNFSKIKNLGFVIGLEDDKTLENDFSKLYFLDYDTYIDCLKKEQKSVKIEVLKDFEEQLV